MNKRTKRFLFYTGGTDSTLLFSMMLDLLDKNHEDELILLVVYNESMRSGQEAKTQRALKYIGRMLITSMDLTERVIDRVSFLVCSQGFPTLNEPLQFNGNVDGNDISLTVKHAESDESAQAYVRSWSAQEVILTSVIPTLLRYFGACRNVIYMGCAGSDPATINCEKLKEIVRLQFEVMTNMAAPSLLENELAEAGLGSYSSNYDRRCLPEYVPVIEFPLMNMGKGRIIAELERRKVTQFVVEKLEHVAGHHMMSDPADTMMKLAVYDEIRRQLDYPADFPGFGEFKLDSSLEVTVSGKKMTVGPDKYEKIMQQAQMDLIERL